MSNFTDVVSGGAMQASQINQLANVLNGTTTGQLNVYGGTTATNVPWTFTLPTGLSGTPLFFTASLNGDADERVAFYLNATSGYGGITAGLGSAAPTASMEGSSGGWLFNQAAHFGSTVTVSGSGSSWSGFTASGNVAITGNATANITGNAGNLAAGGTWDTGSNGVHWTAADNGTNITMTAAKATSGGTTQRGWGLGGNNSGSGAYSATINGSNGTLQLQNTIGFTKFTGTDFGGLTSYSGSISGSGTVSHGLSKTPSTVLTCSGTTASVSAWSGAAAGSYGSSTVVLYNAGTYAMYAIFAVKI